MADFQDLKLVDIDVHRSRYVTEREANVHFALSNYAPDEWSQMFRSDFGYIHYHDHRIELSGKHIVITMPYDQIADIKSQLEHDITATNERYRKTLDERARKEAERRRETETGRDKLSAIRRELFGEGDESE